MSEKAMHLCSAERPLGGVILSAAKDLGADATLLMAMPRCFAALNMTRRLRDDMQYDTFGEAPR